MSTHHCRKDKKIVAAAKKFKDDLAAKERDLKKKEREVA
jgi:hypothetical protein